MSVADTLPSLPKSWARTEFGEFLDIQGGSQPAKKFFSNEPFEGGVRLYQIRDLGKSPVPVYVDKKKVTKFCCAGDIMIGRYGASVGKVFWGRDGAYNVALVKLLFSQQHWDNGYLYHFLKSPYFQRPLGLVSKTAQDGFNKTDLSRFPLPVAPLNEQQRIVEKIETLFAKLDKGEEAVWEVQKLLTQYRQSVLKSAVTGQLTADWRAQCAGTLEHGRDLLARIQCERSANWEGRGKYKEALEPEVRQSSDLPEGWAWASVDQVTSHFGNGLSKKPVLEENEFPILRISAARAMKVSVDDLRYYNPSDGENLDRFWVETGDLLFTRYNGSARLVGVCGQMREGRRFLHPDKLIKARPIGLPDLSTDYLELAWNCGVTRQHIAKNIKTTAGQQGIAGSDVKTAPFPLPSGPEQIEIATRVWDVFDRTEAMAKWCETELKRSASLRQSILKDAFAGKLVPQDPTDEPASALLARIAAFKDTAKKPRRKTTA